MRRHHSGHLNSPWCIPLALALVLAPLVSTTVASMPAPTAPALTDLKGAATDLSHYRGRVVLLNFWATWCGPCRQEMPALDRLYRQLDPARAVIIGVAADERAMVAPFVARLGIRYPIVVGNPDQVFAWTTALGNVTQGLPFSVLLDTRGQARWIQSGTVTVADITRRIGQLVPAQHQ